MLAFGLWWLARAEARARAAGEGFGDEMPAAIAGTAGDGIVRERASVAQAFDPAEAAETAETAETTVITETTALTSDVGSKTSLKFRKRDDVSMRELGNQKRSQGLQRNVGLQRSKTKCPQSSVRSSPTCRRRSRSVVSACGWPYFFFLADAIATLKDVKRRRRSSDVDVREP